MNKINFSFEITNCCDCPYSHEEQIYTPDPFEHETGLYCSKIKELHKYPGAITNDKLIVVDEYDVRKWASIPNWCPLLDVMHGERIL